MHPTGTDPESVIVAPEHVAAIRDLFVADRDHFAGYLREAPDGWQADDYRETMTACDETIAALDHRGVVAYDREAHGGTLRGYLIQRMGEALAHDPLPHGRIEAILACLKRLDEPAPATWAFIM